MESLPTKCGACFCQHLTDIAESKNGAGKRLLLSSLYTISSLQMIILPSQARDKHREEMSKTEMRFSAESVVPYGLVASHWGGTMVEHWQPNSTLNAGVCKNNSGGAYLLRAF